MEENRDTFQNEIEIDYQIDRKEENGNTFSVDSEILGYRNVTSSSNISTLSGLQPLLDFFD